ncbi:TPA: RimK family alpha-L-glutamate ligase [Candidatus Woesearchaeota archaeon]|nr:RimK family alpha-L-glutamate ligase [Candidatus Woesearchaeota archaeon]HIH12719.1 RimK family alpha-L-glutamate ligase [Candidatus Woesearchaeota archaeon]
MKAAIISLGSTTSLMIAEAMKKYFTQVDQINLKKIEVRLGKESGIFYEGKKFDTYDCVYVKGSFRYANLLRSIAALLEGKVPYMPLPANAFTLVHNKLLTHLVLQQYNLPMPRTYVSSTIDTAREVLKRVHYPVVMKFPEGTQGKGVMFADSFSSASSLLDALGALNQPFIIQEYIETDGTDIRVLVVGEKVVAAMRRKAQKEEKRANIHAGGTGLGVELSREAINLALDTAQVLGAEICGVDILESPLGPYVIEANISPGLQGLSKVSPVDLSGEIAKYMFQRTEQEVQRKKERAGETVMKQIVVNNGEPQQVVTSLQFRGDRIILPEIVNKIAQLRERKEYSLKVQKGKVEIEEFQK